MFFFLNPSMISDRAFYHRKYKTYTGIEKKYLESGTHNCGVRVKGNISENKVELRTGSLF